MKKLMMKLLICSGTLAVAMEKPAKPEVTVDIPAIELTAKATVVLTAEQQEEIEKFKQNFGGIAKRFKNDGVLLQIMQDMKKQQQQSQSVLPTENTVVLNPEKGSTEYLQKRYKDAKAVIAATNTVINGALDQVEEAKQETVATENRLTEQLTALGVSRDFARKLSIGIIVLSSIGITVGPILAKYL